MKASSLVLLVTALAVANDLGFRFTENVKRNPRSFQGATITGRVVDRDGQAVGGSFVRLLDSSGEFTAEVVASATGDFRFFAAPGSWTLRALSAAGKAGFACFRNHSRKRATHEEQTKDGGLYCANPPYGLIEGRRSPSASSRGGAERHLEARMEEQNSVSKS